MAPITKSERVPQPMQATFNAIVALTEAFCRAHLDEEYAQLARQATAALSAYPKIFLHIPPIFKMWYVMGR